MISHELKFIFIHIPKTGGNSLSLFLKNDVDDNVTQTDCKLGIHQGISILGEKTNEHVKHERISYYREIYGNIESYFKFTIVRNPYDWIMSYFFWFKGNDYSSFIKEDFISFLQHFVADDTQYSYIYIFDKLEIDRIVKYENLIDELKAIECLKHKDFDSFPWLNKSQNNYQKYYDKELQDLVYSKYKKDFDVFGYNYEI